MSDWKRAERRIAKAVHGQRIPVSGRAGMPDIAHPKLSVEVKSRRTLPRWLVAALSQAERAAQPNQLPIAVLHEHGQPYAKALVVMRLDAFLARFPHADAGK